MARALHIVELITRKRDGGELAEADIADLVDGYLADEVSDAQMSALFMAGLIRGFSVDEAVALTEAYLRSGDVIDLTGLRGPTVDKHSTGGVADTTTLVVAPVLAACGLQVPKLSGRGLGHTGGTLDKLESVPGLRTDLSIAELRDQVERIGLVVAGATANLVPADRRTYALRDVTGTVPSPALIAASVMSKKIAGGAGVVVLDVTVGDGAFMPSVAAAVELAELCVSIGSAHGRRVAALITDMDSPVGWAIGNALEVRAAIDTLHGRTSNLADVSVELAAAALKLTGRVDDLDEGRRVARATLTDGTALQRFAALIEAQGGDPAVCTTPDDVLERAPVVREVPAGEDGTVRRIRARRLGELAVRLGAGRERLDAPVDPAVGFELLVGIGDEVAAGQPVVRIHARTPDDAEAVAAEVTASVEVGAPVPPTPQVHYRIGLD